ncbi:hypothetical protein T01_9993 [Trichinella spiralis]|uniref:Uncharacterized protein n=1 Tax=Trichinella spiralis TaxID=6334 RepID=A0A0V1B1B3_TRISP|nr:hypothetical protein T01_9993 [Trichinella spiralis]
MAWSRLYFRHRMHHRLFSQWITSCYSKFIKKRYKKEHLRRIGGIRFPDPLCEYHGINYFLVTMRNVETNEQAVMIYGGKKLNSS